MTTSKKSRLPTYLAAVAAVLVLFWDGSIPSIPDIVPTPAGPKPHPDLQVQVIPIEQVSKVNKDAAKDIGRAYRAFADVLRRDSRVQSTEQVRAWLTDSNTLLVQGTDLAGSLPGFSNALAGVLEQNLGLENVKVDAATRTKVADLLDAVAWAMGA